MDHMERIIWFLPILFIFHDFEEIIFMKAWITKYKEFLQKKFPKVINRFIAHLDGITTSSFSLGVAEEFIIICLITFLSYKTNLYEVWLGVTIVFSIHLVMHCIQCMIVRHYTPAIVTSILCMPCCYYIIKLTISYLKYEPVIIVLYSVLVLVITLINLMFIHRGMDRFSKWMVRYESKTI